MFLKKVTCKVNVRSKVKSGLSVGQLSHVGLQRILSSLYLKKLGFGVIFYKYIFEIFGVKNPEV